MITKQLIYLNFNSGFVLLFDLINLVPDLCHGYHGSLYGRYFHGYSKTDSGRADSPLSPLCLLHQS